MKTERAGEIDPLPVFCLYPVSPGTKCAAGQSLSGFQRRVAFFSLCFFFFSRRRRLAAPDGFVAILFLTGVSALFSRASSRRIAAALFAYCDRSVLATIRRVPSLSRRLASRSSRISRVLSRRAVCCSRFNRTSTLVSTLLTCWPPGPPPRLVVNSRAESGICSPVRR